MQRFNFKTEEKTVTTKVYTTSDNKDFFTKKDAQRHEFKIKVEKRWGEDIKDKINGGELIYVADDDELEDIDDYMMYVCNYTIRYDDESDFDRFPCFVFLDEQCVLHTFGERDYNKYQDWCSQYEKIIGDNK